VRRVVFLLLVGCGTTTSGSDGGTDASTSDGGGVLNQLGTPCQSGSCPSGLEPVTYCGFAGCGDGGTTMCSCEIKCATDASACPPGSACAFVSDGPGQVCVKN
jgi:hypothetical protein